MGTSQISDGATDGGTTSSGIRGIDVTMDLVDYSAPHFGFRWGVAAVMQLPATTCDGVKDDLPSPERV